MSDCIPWPHINEDLHEPEYLVWIRNDILRLILIQTCKSQIINYNETLL